MASINPMASEMSNHFDLSSDWSKEVALKTAAELDIEMTSAHWDVVFFLRDMCKDQAIPCSAGKIIRELQERFSEEGGKRYLYRLFPRGPVMQASKLAGLPMPPETLDLSFGSVH